MRPRASAAALSRKARTRPGSPISTVRSGAPAAPRPRPAIRWTTSWKRAPPKSNRLHAPPPHALLRTMWRVATSAAAVPGVDSLLSYGTRAVFTPERGMRLSTRGNPAAADLLRHAFADVPGNASLARSWAKFARSWPRGSQTNLLELYPRLD